MSTTPPLTDTHLLADAIEKAIRQRGEEAFEELKKELISRLEREKSAIIGGVAIDVMKLVSFETIRENLVITVHLKK